MKKVIFITVFCLLIFSSCAKSDVLEEGNNPKKVEKKDTVDNSKKLEELSKELDEANSKYEEELIKNKIIKDSVNKFDDIEITDTAIYTIEHGPVDETRIVKRFFEEGKNDIEFAGKNFVSFALSADEEHVAMVSYDGENLDKQMLIIYDDKAEPLMAFAMDQIMAGFNDGSVGLERIFISGFTKNKNYLHCVLSSGFDVSAIFVVDLDAKEIVCYTYENMEDYYKFNEKHPVFNN